MIPIVASPKNRDPYAILSELRRRGYNFSRVARDVGVSSQVAFTTAHGMANNKKVLRRMLEIGVPAELLYLPQVLQQRETAA